LSGLLLAETQARGTALVSGWNEGAICARFNYGGGQATEQLLQHPRYDRDVVFSWVVNSTSETDGIGKSKPASSGGRCQAREASTGDHHPAEVVTGMRKEVDYG
jgi:hypothetical protein